MEIKSLIVPNLVIDLGNYLTEILIINQCKKFKKQVPSVPFWKKEYSGLNKDLFFISKNYGLELSAIKDYLLIFAPSVLIAEFHNSNLHTVRFLKKEERKELLYKLFNRQVKYIRSLENFDTVKFEALSNKSTTFENLPNFETKKNLMGNL